MAKYEVIMPMWRPTTINRLLRMHWRVRAKTIAKEKADIFYLTRDIPAPRGKRKVSLHFTLNGNQKEPDDDAVWKGILDGLVFSGVLIDDNRAGVELGEITYSRDSNWGTKIVLEDVTDGF